MCVYLSGYVAIPLAIYQTINLNHPPTHAPSPVPTPIPHNTDNIHRQSQQRRFPGVTFNNKQVISL